MDSNDRGRSYGKSCKISREPGACPCDRSGVAPGHSIAQRAFDYLAAARDTRIAGISDPGESLVARCLAYAHFGLSQPGYYRLMFGAELSPDVFTRAYASEDSAIRRSYDVLVEAIRRCQEAGAACDDTDPLLIAALLWPALHGQVSLRIDRPDFPRPPLDEVITQTVERLVGLRRK